MGPPGRGGGPDRELHRLARGSGQQRPRAAHRVDRLPVHRHQLVARMDGHAGGGQRRAGPRVGRLAGQHPVHQPAPGRVPGQVRAELPDRRVLRRRARRRLHVGVRRAGLAEQFPEQVGEVGRAADPVQQRPVLLRTPSQSTPDMSGTQKSRRMTRPASAYACRHSAAGSAWNRARDVSTVTVSAVSSRLPEAGMTRSSPSVVHDQPRAVAADVEPVDLAGDLGDLALAQVEPFQSRAREGVVQVRAALAEHAGDLGAAPDQAALDRAQAGVAGLDDRHRHHAVRQAGGVDRHRGRLGRVAVLLPGLGAHRPALGQRPERRRGVLRERHQVRAAAERERQVEGLRVVDRVEAAHRQKSQEPAVGGEHRIGVREPAVGHLHDLVGRWGGPCAGGAAAAARAGTRPARPSPATRTARRWRRRRTRPAR